MTEPEQTEYYSGKQKDDTVKNTVIANSNTTILYIGPTVLWNKHDYGLFKQEFDPKQDWFKPFKLWADLGYNGFDKDYDVKQLHYRPCSCYLCWIMEFQNSTQNSNTLLSNNSNISIFGESDAILSSFSSIAKKSSLPLYINFLVFFEHLKRSDLMKMIFYYH